MCTQIWLHFVMNCNQTVLHRRCWPLDSPWIWIFCVFFSLWWVGEDKYANHGFLFAPFNDSNINPNVGWLVLIKPCLVAVLKQPLSKNAMCCHRYRGNIQLGHSWKLLQGRQKEEQGVGWSADLWIFAMLCAIKSNQGCFHVWIQSLINPPSLADIKPLKSHKSTN